MEQLPFAGPRLDIGEEERTFVVTQRVVAERSLSLAQLGAKKTPANARRLNSIGDA